MTLSLAFMEPTSAEQVPEEYDDSLECASLAICCAFNRRGSLLAVGCNDGRIVIWDFINRTIAKSIAGHANHPICSLNWSRNGYRLVSASLDNSIAVWNVETGECAMRWRFSSPLLKTQFNPRNDKLILVCPLKHPPILIEVESDDTGDDEINGTKAGPIHTKTYKILPMDQEDNDPNIVASFDRRGKYIYTGNARGRLVVIVCPRSLDQTPEIVSSFRLQTSSSTPAAIREIEFGARNKTRFLVNSSDRTIRMYDCESALKAGIDGTCEEIRKFQDLVNKTMWRRCCFSGDKDGSHVCGGTARQHSLYIWDSENGTIKKMLQGTKGEQLLDVQWHPLRPIVTSISSGIISIWDRPKIENWSAFAPDFQELEENLEYDEKESEFDLEDEDKKHYQKKELSDTDLANVDVTSIKPDPDLLSSDEDEPIEALEYIKLNIDDCDAVELTQGDIPPAPRPDGIKNPANSMDIKLANAPIGMDHPLSSGSGKRLRMNDKANNSRKIPRQN